MTYLVDNTEMLQFATNTVLEQEIVGALLKDDAGCMEELLRQHQQDLDDILSGDFGSCLLLVLFEKGSPSMMEAFLNAGYSIHEIAWDGYDRDSHGPFVNFSFSSIASCTFSLERLKFLEQCGVWSPSHQDVVMGICYGNEDVYSYFRDLYFQHIRPNLQSFEDEATWHRIILRAWQEQDTHNTEELRDEKILARLNERVTSMVDELLGMQHFNLPNPPYFLMVLDEGDVSFRQLVWTRHLLNKDQVVVDTIGSTLLSQGRLAHFACVVPFMSKDTVLDLLGEYCSYLDTWVGGGGLAQTHQGFNIRDRWVDGLQVIVAKLDEGNKTPNPLLQPYTTYKFRFMTAQLTDASLLERELLALRLLPQTLQNITYKPSKKM